jgi:outer membrane protein assembly factor BamB
MIAAGADAPGDLIAGVLWGVQQASSPPPVRLVVLDAATGEERWSTPERAVSPSTNGADTGGFYQASAQSVADDASVYLAVDSQLTSYDLASGAMRWEKPFDGYLVGSFGGHLVVVTSDEAVQSVSVGDGHIEWALTVPTLHAPPIAVANSTQLFITNWGVPG